MEQVVLKAYHSRIAAELDRGFLATHGIPTLLMADDEGGLAPYLLTLTGYAKLIVNKKDHKKALQLLK